MKRVIPFLLLFWTACGERLYVPNPPVPDDYLYARGFSQDSLPRDIRWWEVFCDTTLNRLEETALRNNRDLAAAASRVEAARLNLAVARAPYLPQFGAGITAEGDYLSDTKITQKYSVEPSVSWEISLFGTLRNADRAARAEILSTEWAYRGVLLSLTSEVATAYFTLLQYDRDLEIARRSYELRRQSAALIDSMFRYGMSNSVALEQARSLVYTAAADIPQYERAVEQTRLSLGILLGQNPRPADAALRGTNLTADYQPIEVPVGLPSDLLHRRPDIMEAFYDMRKAAAQVGVAHAVRFPSVSLTGSGGIFATSIKGLTSGNPWTWSAAGSITQPIFAFGKLKRQEQIAREQYIQSVYAYEQAIIQALADVEQALVSITTYRKQTERYAALVMANNDIAMKTKALYDSGMTAYLDVIDAERSLYESQMEFANLTAQQYINYVDLYKALGGGW